MSSNLLYKPCSLHGEWLKLTHFRRFLQHTDRKWKISENELTSIVRRAFYRLHTEDLKTDPERKLLKEFLSPFGPF